MVISIRSANSAGVGGRPSFASSFLVASANLLALDRTKSRHPVHRSQFVEHGTPNSRNAIRFEFDAARKVERVNGVHEAEDASGNQIVQFNAIRQSCPDAFAVVLDQGQVVFHESIA